MKMRLAQEQREVVLAEPGDIFVAAAAGSGKTRVLVARFVAAVLGETGTGPCDVEDVLAVTFTEKAAGEISERVRGALLAEGRGAEARNVERAWISTIHGMCSKILRRHAFEAGLDPRFSVVTQVEAGILQLEALEKAARALMIADSGVERLVVDLGTTRVAGMIDAVHSAVRSMGKAISDIELPPLSPDSEIQEYVSAFSGIADEYPRLGSSDTILVGADSARACAESLQAYLGREDREAGALKALQVLSEGKFGRRGAQAVKELSEAAMALVERAQSALVQAVSLPYEAALLRLVAGFDAEYAELKAASGALDFEDLQLKTAELLETHPEIAAAYKADFRLVMIDEFQDTNALQLRIAQAVSDGTLMTVGDDKQSIYRFRHADVGVFRALAESAERNFLLRSNYRSHPEVIAAVNEIFDTATFFAGDFVRLAADRVEEVPYPWPDGESRVRFLLTDGQGAKADDRRQMEATAIAGHLAALRDKGVPQGDMVVLLRAMTGRAERIESALRAEGFDVYTASGGTYFDRPEVDEVTALLAAVDNVRNDAALMKVLAGRLVALEESSLYHLARAAGRGCLWDALVSDAVDGLSPVDRAAIERFVVVMSQLRRNRGRRGIAELIHEACELLDYDLTLFAGGPSGPRAWANVLKLGRLAEEYETRSAGDLGGFLEYVSLHKGLAPETQATLTGEGIDAVRIMSIHASKGLEFPVVVVGDLASGGQHGSGEVLLGRTGDRPLLSMRLPKALLPGEKSIESPEYSRMKEAEAAEEAAEADRLLYVACTRARECLIMSATIDVAKDATGGCDVDRLRRAAGIAGPASGLGELVELGPETFASIHQQSIETPPPVPCEAIPTVEPVIAELPVAPLAPSPATVPRNISYTGLSVYHQCAYKFYATRIARLRTPEPPGSAGPLGFGSAVHAVLQLSGSGAPGPDRIAAIARANGVDDGDVDRLTRAAEAYLGSEAAAAVADADRVHRECPFAMPIGETLLRGNIDLLAWHGKHATVIDYKTGSGELSAVDAEARYRSQAECYALAVLEGGAERATVRFVEVERGCRETRFEFAPADAAPIRDALSATVGAISDGRFDHLGKFTPGVCTDCPALGGTCPVNPRSGGAAGAGHKRR